MLGYVVNMFMTSELLSLQNRGLPGVGLTRSSNQSILKSIMGKSACIRFCRPPTIEILPHQLATPIELQPHTFACLPSPSLAPSLPPLTQIQIRETKKTDDKSNCFGFDENA